MKFTIEIRLGNEAMQTGEDVAYALRQVANKVTLLNMNISGEGYRIRDLNGNTVGTWSCIDDK